MAETGPKSDGTFWRMTNNTKEPRLAAAGQLRRSRNHADGFDEKGVSVADGAHYTMAGYTHGYRVTGEVVGLGSDGEPLLDPKTIRVLSKIMASDNIDAEQRVVDRAAEDAALTLMDWTRTHYRAAMTHLVGMSVEEFARHRAGGGGQRPAS